MTSEHGYHADNGFYFKRLPNNGVQITLLSATGDVVFKAEVNDLTWADVIASVSARGIPFALKDALKFHNDPVGSRRRNDDQLHL